MCRLSIKVLYSERINLSRDLQLTAIDTNYIEYLIHPFGIIPDVHIYSDEFQTITLKKNNIEGRIPADCMS